jgi:histidinol dehydrogenase
MLPIDMMRIVDRQDTAFEPLLRALVNRAADASPSIETSAREIIRQVRGEGDAAVRRLTFELERRELHALEIPRAEWASAMEQVDPGVLRAMKHAASRVRAFHEREQHTSFEIPDAGGARVGQRSTPLGRVGLYVPGGKARYPSSVIMTAIPARVAGVREIFMTTPSPSLETLAAATLSGVDRIFSIGGAQAIAAMAYGTESLPRVDKIVGPGNAYVAAAKRLVFGDVGIDSIAGPTELVIAADASAEPRWVAADLLAQAEHDELAVPILVAVGRDVAERVAAAVATQLAVLPRRAIAEQSLRGQGVILVVDSAAQAIEVVEALAAEHVELALTNAREWAARVTTAGALFLGNYTPESVGDYIAGPSHVLPTGGSARFASPLGVTDFIKRTSIIEYDAQTLQTQASDIECLAEVEGLSAHAEAIRIRFSGGQASDQGL